MRRSAQYIITFCVDAVPQVLAMLYKKYNDAWLVELLYDDLLAWNTWFVNERMLGPLGLISLGSNNISGYHDFAAGELQGARFESGLVRL